MREHNVSFEFMALYISEIREQVQKIISYIQSSRLVLRSSCGVQVNYPYYNAIGVFYLKTPHEYDLVARSRQIEMQLVLAVTWNLLNSSIRGLQLTACH